nr:hypothetical protein [Streptomyces sp. VMFN-G11Ma]
MNAWPVGIPSAQCGDGGEVPAGAVAHQQQTFGVAAVVGDVLGDPVEGRPGIVGGRGELVLGCQPVLGRHHDDAGGVRERTRRFVDDREVPGHETAAMEIQHHREWAVRGRNIDVEGKLMAVAAVPRGGEPPDRFGGQLETRERADHLPHLTDVQLIERWEALLLKTDEKSGSVLIECHGGTHFFVIVRRGDTRSQY